MKFWEFYRIIWKRRAMIAGLVAATLAVILVATANRPLKYEAVAQIMPSDAVLQRPILWSVSANGGAEQRVEHRDR
ncbi:MAG TPA: hypothetical protein PLP86_08495, partial [Armatimonadota bacterium]|nr:hypothetical protein [Armatimonadota bacterium]